MFIQSGGERCQTLGSREQKDETLNTQAVTREFLARSDEESFHKEWLNTGICAPTGYEGCLKHGQLNKTSSYPELSNFEIASNFKGGSALSEGLDQLTSRNSFNLSVLDL